MARGAKGLPVVPVPEQSLVATVRNLVIDQCGLGPAHGTERVQAQELGPCPFPFARVAALAAVRAFPVVAAFTVAL